MNGYLIDTNVLSEFGRSQPPEPKVKQWIQSADPRSLFASVVTWGELRKGIESKSPAQRRPAWNNGLSAICGTGFNPVSCR
jgi:predicted nucleic acid-binding protein